MLSITTDSKGLDAFKLLKTLSAEIKGQPINMEFTVKICNAVLQNKDLADIVPQEWLQYVNSWIQTFADTMFWKHVGSLEDYNYMRYTRRFFPITEDNPEWKALATTIVKADYPEFDEKKKLDTTPNNYAGVRDIKTASNYSSIPVMTKTQLADVKLMLPIIHLVIDFLRLIGSEELLAKFVYLLNSNYIYCHLSVVDAKMNETIAHLMKSHHDLTVHGLWYAMYILAHEESVSTNPTAENRFVFRLKDVHAIKWNQAWQIDVSPWITNCIASKGTPYDNSIFYLSGHRSLAPYPVFLERFAALTNGVFKGVEVVESLSIIGSILMECLGNNMLLSVVPTQEDKKDECIRPVTTSDLNYTLEDPNDMKGFLKRDELYFPSESSFGSDIDVAISSESYKEFITKAHKAIEIINKNAKETFGDPFTMKEMSVVSGIRFHLSHPKMTRKIEIFRTPMNPMKLVSNFHVACVRMYWDFKEIYMTRGCAASLMTGVNENFNWFSANKIPPDVVLKYAQRGYTTILNDKELKCIEAYMARNGSRWHYGFSKLNEITGKFTFDHPFFRVDSIPRGIRLGLKTKGSFVGQFDANTYSLMPPLMWKEKPMKKYELVEGKGYVITPPIEF